jgi:hypothetical protein
MKKTISIIALLLLWHPAFPQTVYKLKINWDKPIMVCKTSATLQIVNSPLQMRNSAIHNELYKNVKKLNVDYARYVAYFIYPKLAVPELDPPASNKTSWDFSLIDPQTIDFFKATKGHPIVFNFSTVPQWMFENNKVIPYPKSVYDISWQYGFGGGSKLRDTSLSELSSYFARIFCWYNKGGFTDEAGKYHHSGYHYPIPYWEVFNEPEAEHQHTPQLYTKHYDAIVNTIKKLSPGTKFVGMALISYWNPQWFSYFLNPANHVPGTPLDMISFHFYSGPESETEKFSNYHYDYFGKSDVFIRDVARIDSIRGRLSPNTRINIDEAGTMLSAQDRFYPIPPAYWNLSASVFAYLYIKLSRLGVDVIAESGLVASYDLFPDVTMSNWQTGNPNARYRVLKLINDNFKPGDTLFETDPLLPDNADYLAQAYVCKNGKKALFLNKRNKTVMIKLPPEFLKARISSVDISTGENMPFKYKLKSDTLLLRPFAVVVASLR